MLRLRRFTSLRTMAASQWPRSSTATSGWLRCSLFHHGNHHFSEEILKLMGFHYRGIRTTAQFNSKIFYPSDQNKSHLWTSDPLSNYGFDKEKYSFHADKCALSLSEDGSFYIIKSTTNLQCVVNLKFSRAAPGFVVGKNGSSTFGTDPQKPWGSMRHAFWPRCKVEGTFMTKDGEINMQGLGCFSHALQGMKPHHAGMPPHKILGRVSIC